LFPATIQKVYATNQPLTHFKDKEGQALLCSSTVQPTVNTLKGVKIKERQMEETAAVGIQQ